MHYKIGLKLWSINDQYIQAAQDLFQKGVYDFIELYAVPGSFDQYAGKWKELNIPVNIHAPHEIDFSQEGQLEKNLEMFKEVEQFSDFFESNYIIVHPGIGGRFEHVLQQIKALVQQGSPSLKDKLHIENMPHIALDDQVCVGSRSAEIKQVIEECSINFCFDICHATKAAVHFKHNIIDYVEQFVELKPTVIHLSDGHNDSFYDEHLSIGNGKFDFYWIKGVIERTSCSNIVLEMEKTSKTDLDQFAQDAQKVKELLTTSVALEN